MSRKIQGVHEILIGPVGQFQSVTKGVQTVQRGSLNVQECDPWSTLVVQTEYLKFLNVQNNIYYLNNN